MYDFKIWIDADSCPTLVKEYLLNIGKEKSLNENFVANKQIELLSDSPFIKMFICEKTNGAADDFIFEKASENDIVITRDILFAARLVEKNIFVTNDRGYIFTKSNIQDRLAERNLNLNLSILGLNEKSPNRYSQNELKKFKETFEKQVFQLIVNENFLKNRK